MPVDPFRSPRCMDLEIAAILLNKQKNREVEKMEELFIETKNGKERIDPGLVQKLNLEKGSLSPFTRSRIVGKNGEFPYETATERDPKNNGRTQKPEDGIVETENVTFSTSEIIDLAHGEDSKTEH